MSGKVSSTLRVLMQIRDEQAAMRARMDALESTVTLEMRAVASVLVDVRDLLRDRLDVRDTVRDHEQRIAALERRVG
ncbi:MAG: hypothetical protein U0353_25940 [Sandaracinus sp.]